MAKFSCRMGCCLFLILLIIGCSYPDPSGIAQPPEPPETPVQIDMGIQSCKNPVFEIRDYSVNQSTNTTSPLYIMSMNIPDSAVYEIEMAEAIRQEMNGYSNSTATTETVLYDSPIAVFCFTESSQYRKEKTGTFCFVPVVSDGKILFAYEVAQIGSECIAVSSHSIGESVLNDLAGLTTPETPLYYVIDGPNAYAVIGKFAFKLYDSNTYPTISHLPDLYLGGIDCYVTAIQ